MNEYNMVEFNNKYDIYSMKLHQTIKVGKNLFITKVPGGWLYTICNQMDVPMSCEFVPYNEEYYKNELKE